MKHSRLPFLSAAMLVFGFACGAAMAQPASLKPLTIKLPPETARLKPSTLPGYQAAVQKCGICHSADYINLQPPAMTQPQWTAEVRKMQHAYAAPLTDKEVADIGEYLAVAYGNAKPSGTAAVPPQMAKSGAACGPALAMGHGCQ